MSRPHDLLILLDPDGRERERLRIDDRGSVSAEAGGTAGARVSLAVPGEQVSIHWLDLDPALTAPQAAAAARLMLSELSAQPLAEMHVAAGGVEEGRRCVALVPNAAMESWLASAQAEGLDPTAIIPEPLLLPLPEEGYLRLNGAARPIYRGRASAFSVEDELAELLIGDSPVAFVERAAFEAELRPQLEAPLLNLRQGAFARRRRFRIDPARARRIALMTATLIFLTILIQVAAAMRYTLAADRADEEARQIARSVLGPSAAGAGPDRIRQQLAALGGGGAGFGTLAPALFAAVRATPNAELAGLTFDQGDGLSATVRADSPDSIGQVVQRIEAGGFRVDAAPARVEGGRQTSRITARAR
jgi:general secretion pathway protein L